MKPGDRILLSQIVRLWEKVWLSFKEVVAVVNLGRERLFSWGAIYELDLIVGQA